MSKPTATVAWPANEIIRASAGSGKTYQLCLRYLELLCRDAHCQSILAMTFTRKAAAEMLDRVVKLLASAAQSEALAAEYAQQMGDCHLHATRARHLLRHVVTNLHRLQIGTLDSFFSRLARANSMQIGLHPHWEIGEITALDRIRQAAISRVLAQDNTLDLLRLMSKGDVHRNVSEMMLDTVERLYEVYLDALPGAWDPFPHAAFPAAGALEEILQQIESIPLSGSTAKPRDSDIAKARAADWDGLAAAGYFARIAAGEDTYSRKPIPADLLAAYRRLVDYVRALVRARLRESTQATYQLLHKFDQQFTALKHQAGLFEFGDVTRWLQASGQPLGDAAWIARRLDLPVEHLLLDEFQDTAPRQWQILQPIAESIARPGTPRTFFCVGDMKQAIYGWRGGVAEVFELVEDQLPDLQRRDLVTSYRSSQIVIDTVNRVFENLSDYASADPETNATVQRWGTRFLPHATQRDLSGYCELRVMEEGDEASAPRLAYLVQTIRSIWAADPRWSIGILTYQNADIPPIIAGLQREGLAASEEGGTPLDDSASVDLLISLLHLVDHPDDTSCWFHLAESPLARDLGVPAYHVALGRREVPVEVHAFAARVRRELSERGYGATLGRWALLAAPNCTEHELRRLQKLVELADEYDAQATLRARDFIELLQATKVEDPSSAGIRVMTIHKSKGLEFDVVIVPHLSKGLAGQTDEVIVQRDRPTDPISLVCRRVGAETRTLLPPQIETAYRQQRGRRVSESLCVLYVALTRARRALHLLVAPSQTPRHQTPAGILLATLSGKSASAADGLLYSHGDPHWMLTPSPSRAQASPPPPSPDPIFYLREPNRTDPLRLAKSAPAGRHPRGISPSRRAPERQEGAAPRNAGDLFRRSATSPAMTRGALLHAMLAQVHWLDGPEPWSERRFDRLRPRCSDLKLWRAAIAELNAMVRQPKLAELLNRPSYLARIAARIPATHLAFDSLSAVVETERPFAIREQDGALITGAIDRCVQVHGGGALQFVEVIDFKTDAIDRREAADLEAHVQFYQPQVAAYRRAAARVFGLPEDRVWATLVFTAIDLAVDVR